MIDQALLHFLGFMEDLGFVGVRVSFQGQELHEYEQDILIPRNVHNSDHMAVESAVRSWNINYSKEFSVMAYEYLGTNDDMIVFLKYFDDPEDRRVLGMQESTIPNLIESMVAGKLTPKQAAARLKR